MSLNLQEIIKYAAHCINCISKLEIGRIEVARRVRTRARQLFETLTYQGLPYLFAYVGGKATERRLFELYDTICKDADTESIAKELLDKIKGMSDEDASYGLYGASIMCIISKVTGINLRCSLEELIYKYGFDKLIQQVAYNAAKWLKFFAEAKLPE